MGAMKMNGRRKAKVDGAEDDEDGIGEGDDI